MLPSLFQALYFFMPYYRIKPNFKERRLRYANIIGISITCVGLICNPVNHNWIDSNMAIDSSAHINDRRRRTDHPIDN